MASFEPNSKKTHLCPSLPWGSKVRRDDSFSRAFKSSKSHAALQMGLVKASGQHHLLAASIRPRNWSLIA